MPFGPSARTVGGFILALGLALAAEPTLADQAYPPGLFENSPVVPHGQQYADPPADPADPAATAPDADAQPDDYCADVAGRTFTSLAEVKRAHARCDRLRDAPPGED